MYKTAAAALVPLHRSDCNKQRKRGNKQNANFTNVGRGPGSGRHGFVFCKTIIIIRKSNRVFVWKSWIERRDVELDWFTLRHE